MKNSMVVTELNIYPVKSLAGISLSESKLVATGLEYDRRWMVVDPDGKFMTQRKYPQMAKIQPYFHRGELVLTAPQASDHLPAPDLSKRTMSVSVWDATIEAQGFDGETDDWLSQVLGTACRLVYFPDEARRQVDPKYAKAGDQTAFSDEFPLLLISKSSLDDLNQKLGQEPVTMKRFRPNIVLSGCLPFAEDAWQRIRIGAVTMRVVKACSRCVITTIDPETGDKASQEPLKTLSRYRKLGNKVMFGQNVIHDHEGHLSVGDPVAVLEAQTHL